MITQLYACILWSGPFILKRGTFFRTECTLVFTTCSHDHSNQKRDTSKVAKNRVRFQDLLINSTSFFSNSIPFEKGRAASWSTKCTATAAAMLLSGYSEKKPLCLVVMKKEHHFTLRGAFITTFCSNM